MLFLIILYDIILKKGVIYFRQVAVQGDSGLHVPILLTANCLINYGNRVKITIDI